MEEKETVLNYGRVSYAVGEDGEARFLLNGELDHHSVKEIREVMDGKLTDYRPMSVTFDLSGVSFTDSAGLGLILGRYTKISGYGGALRLVGVSEEFMKILKLSGADRLFPVEARSEKRRIRV